MKEPFNSSKPKNRADEIALPKSDNFSVTLYDVDLAIMEYMRDVVLPELEEDKKKIKVPVLYGNPERWKSARKDGVLRDVRGRLQLPLVMYKRNSIERDAASNSINRYLSYPTYQKYNQRNKYDKFSLLNGAQPSPKNYNITVPDYVSITYEVMVWTSYTEHMNQIVEQFQYATDDYWGDKDKFKFRVRIDSFDNQTEVGQGTERIVRTTFTMAVNAYLLPEQFDNKPTTAKEYTPKKVVFGYEADLTGGGGGVNPVKQKTINQYSDVLDFLAIRGSVSGSFIDADTMKISNVEVPKLPPSLEGNFDVSNWFKIYINGLFIPSEKYTYYVSSSANQVEFNFSTGSIGTATSTTLGYEITGSDEFGIVGKFKEL